MAPARSHACCFLWGLLTLRAHDRCALASELWTWHRGSSGHCCAICFPWGCRTDLIVPFQGACLSGQKCCLVTRISSLIVLSWGKGKSAFPLYYCSCCVTAPPYPHPFLVLRLVVLRVSCSVLNWILDTLHLLNLWSLSSSAPRSSPRHTEEVDEPWVSFPRYLCTQLSQGWKNAWTQTTELVCVTLIKPMIWNLT